MIGLSGVLGAVGGIVNGIDKLFSSDHELSEQETLRLQEKVKVELARIQAQVQQIAINAEQAKHPSIFVAGARPVILWIFAAGLGYNTILHPLLEWVLVLTDVSAEAAPPRFDMQELVPMVAGILGLAGWRSWEKKSGVARENMRNPSGISQGDP